MVSKPILTIFYQFNPWQSSIGGIQTVIRSFVKYCPTQFDLRLVGIQNDSSHPLGKWQERELFGKAIRFMPVLTIKDDNIRQLIPTTIKYTAALWQQRIVSDFLHFHRIEPTLAALNWPGEKTLFVHNDIQQQVAGKDNKDTILWRHFPTGYLALEGFLVNQFTQILSCNSRSTEHYQQRYPAIADRVSTIKNTVDNEIFYPLTQEEKEEKRRNLAQEMDLPEDTQFLLFAGRLHPQKQPILLLESLRSLNRTKVHLLVVGDGELREEIRSKISILGIGKQVTMLGSLASGELSKLMRVCQGFVLTSAYEGLPVVVLEALACGLPIVTTRCGETPNLLSANSGVVCQESTPSAIAAAISLVLENPDRYPIEACLASAQPFSARSVVGAIGDEMLAHWDKSRLSHIKNNGEEDISEIKYLYPSRDSPENVSAR
ncbi:MAG TPA: glycoside hydrolase [Cyanobacteria bacterium UBA11149]|nr:glycoside hydrolase [Cyanobacteria bacterium UBA11367]HBE60930.1 glycoside hydrolase [Cyanobacteria bacterium UBA11366]HBK62431.1 glycoside hydrolase [Cyanobacteria bacterium UBA11166]HBR76392.1 glycoside hydrolase [Cyanobacteria bacterium UBA11159]HBS72047.1 glycoside hydrolase [Cyanobacteria bacterium UBA11153]HBW92368.1 glycoside hydrolase [Cyanobacteria bacterium UBA11149]HCA95461.1 glycoside hydrolase [Cyanobacteria bacterium UBA9226]